MRNPSRLFSVLAVVLVLVAAGTAQAEQTPPTGEPPLSLLTDTPEQGLELAIRLARKTVTTIQTDKSVLHAQRPSYAENAEDLIAASHVVAVHFQTVARANDYWRD